MVNLRRLLSIVSKSACFLLAGLSHGSNTISEVTDPNNSAGNIVQPYNVYANSSGDFFIINNNGFSGFTGPGIVGWYYPPGSTTATEITDPMNPAGNTVVPLNVFANGSGDFFITNFHGFRGTTNAIVGWSYNPGSGLTTATEITDTMNPAGNTVTPYNVFANGSGDFFITNFQGFTGPNGIVG